MIPHKGYKLNIAPKPSITSLFGQLTGEKPRIGKVPLLQVSLCDRIMLYKIELMNQQKIFLIFGDILVIAVIAIIGFASHGTLGSSGMRMLATLVPFLAAWFASAIPLKALDPQLIQGKGIWRPLWAVILAAPLGAWLRGIWLQMPVLTTFVLVMIAFLLLGMFLWRLLYNFLIYPRIIK